jgi:hypothetical protein
MKRDCVIDGQDSHCTSKRKRNLKEKNLLQTTFDLIQTQLSDALHIEAVLWKDLLEAKSRVTELTATLQGVAATNMITS